MSIQKQQGERLGATPLPGGECAFVVWAPGLDRVQVKLLEEPARTVAMERDERGYHRAIIEKVPPGTLYKYRLSRGKERPDPASRLQPQGVHGPSAVVERHFHWTDRGWTGIALPDYVIYEMHVGTFSHDGTFDGVIPHLDTLRDLGVTAIELMPVAQFPGSRNWGYDGVYPFAVQDSYGGPDGLRRLVDACHARGLAVVLDVVYNHFGPEGSYLAEYGPYFTDKYNTPWGQALNFDAEHASGVRRYFIENALQWVDDYHIDALRLDAVHSILDLSAIHFLEELSDAVHRRAEALGRRIHLIAESDLNAPRMIRPPELGGYGLDAQWSDDFHHALHALLTGEKQGYYADFGRVEHLGRAFKDAFVYAGEMSEHRARVHGRPATGIPGQRFVVCAQNHDQVGNRMVGDRLAKLATFEELKLAAAAVVLSPYIPMLFMGEEYGETAPFPYFVNHSDRALVEAVRNGRRDEFKEFRWAGEPPDPQALGTFESARLNHELREDGRHRSLWELYRELLRLRREEPALRDLSRDRIEVWCSERETGIRNPPDTLAPPYIDTDLREPAGYDHQRLLLVRRRSGPAEVVLLLHFGEVPSIFEQGLPLPAGKWRTVIDTADERWSGPGSAFPKEIDSASEDVKLPAQAAILLERISENQG